LEHAADKDEGFEHQWKHIDVPLLEQQEAYFIYAMGCLMFLQAEYPQRMRKKKVPHPFKWLPRLQQPPKHNLASQHVPPWLSESRQRRHKELAEQQEQSARPRSRKSRPQKQSAKQRRERAMKRAKK
jgi:hypothetical protein